MKEKRKSNSVFAHNMPMQDMFKTSTSHGGTWLKKRERESLINATAGRENHDPFNKTYDAIPMTDYTLDAYAGLRKPVSYNLS